MPSGAVSPIDADSAPFSGIPDGSRADTRSPTAASYPERCRSAPHFGLRGAPSLLSPVLGSNSPASTHSTGLESSRSPVLSAGAASSAHNRSPHGALAAAVCRAPSEHAVSGEVVSSRQLVGSTTGHKSSQSADAKPGAQDHTLPRQPAHQVFLGGACNPTTWRKDVAIPALTKAGVTYYNPQVDDWYPELIDIEARAKETATIVFFVVSSDTRGIASMIEVSELITSGRDVVLVLQDVEPGATIDDAKLPLGEIKDLNRGRAYLADVASRHGFPVFQSIDAGVNEVLRKLGKRDGPPPDEFSP